MIWERNVMRHLQRGRLGSSGSGVETFEIDPNLIKKAVDLHVDGNPDGMGKTKSVGRPVTLHCNPWQPQKTPPIVAARVEPQSQFAQRMAREQITDARRERMPE